jgi:hypothetical protein
MARFVVGYGMASILCFFHRVWDLSYFAPSGWRLALRGHVAAWGPMIFSVDDLSFLVVSGEVGGIF